MNIVSVWPQVAFLMDEPVLAMVEEIQAQCRHIQAHNHNTAVSLITTSINVIGQAVILITALVCVLMAGIILPHLQGTVSCVLQWMQDLRSTLAVIWELATIVMRPSKQQWVIACAFMGDAASVNVASNNSNNSLVERPHHDDATFCFS
jgi:hypothetical protein